jgi:cytochrome P450
MLGASKIANSPFLGLYRSIRRHFPAIQVLLIGDLAQSIVQFRSFAAAALQKRMADKSNRNDFVSYLDKARDPDTGKGLDKKDLMSDIRLLIIAGTDTTATTMAATFFYLVRNERVLRKVTEEVRGKFKSAEDIVMGTELSSCQYLRAVIDEAMRLAPPLPSSLTRKIRRPGSTVDGHPLPVGTDVGTSLFALHRSAEYFSDPLAFKPERWLVGQASEEEIARQKSAFHPFSSGIRNCVGKPLAYAELLIAFGRLLSRFDIRSVEGDRKGADRAGQFDIKDVYIVDRKGPMVQFRKRAGE